MKLRTTPWVLLALTACDTGSSSTVSDMSTAGNDLAIKAGSDMAIEASGDMATATGDMATATGDMAMAAGSIPDPGTGHGVDSNFGNVEPNDSPSQATPLGVASSASVYLWVSGNAGGGTDTEDYFVFKTSASAGTFTLSTGGLCWGGSITGITATLWKVVSGQQMLPPVQTWASTASCTPPGTAPALEANTEYLLGLAISGGSGTYFA
jgi:hypothetical protein